jgi:hypothetical protein
MARRLSGSHYGAGAKMSAHARHESPSTRDREPSIGTFTVPARLPVRLRHRRIPMESDVRPAVAIVNAQSSVSWAAVAAGAVGTAALGGELRDSTWNDRVLTPRTT